MQVLFLNNLWKYHLAFYINYVLEPVINFFSI